jgi:hypothetical protein
MATVPEPPGGRAEGSNASDGGLPDADDPYGSRRAGIWNYRRR